MVECTDPVESKLQSVMRFISENEPVLSFDRLITLSFLCQSSRQSQGQPRIERSKDHSWYGPLIPHYG